MASEAEQKDAGPLPSGGIELLAQFIMHQDSVSWTGLSVFLTGDFLLIGIALQTRIPLIPWVGVLLTGSSLGILARSYLYLDKYYEMAKARCNPSDREIFDVKLARDWSLADVPAFYYVFAVHVAFILAWIGLALSP